MLGKLHSHFRQYGTFGGLKLLILGRLKHVLNSESFLFLELTRGKLEISVTAPDDVEIRALRPDERDLIQNAIRRDALPNETVFVALRDVEPLGFALTQHGGVYNFGMGAVLMIPDDIIVLKGLFVRPEERGNRIGYFLNEARIAKSHCGHRRVYVSAITANRAALKNLRKIGFQEIAEITRWSILGRPVRRSTRSLVAGSAVPTWLREFR